MNDEALEQAFVMWVSERVPVMESLKYEEAFEAGWRAREAQADAMPRYQIVERKPGTPTTPPELELVPLDGPLRAVADRLFAALQRVGSLESRVSPEHPGYQHSQDIVKFVLKALRREKVVLYPNATGWLEPDAAAAPTPSDDSQQSRDPQAQQHAEGQRDALDEPRGEGPREREVLYDVNGHAAPR